MHVIKGPVNPFQKFQWRTIQAVAIGRRCITIGIRMIISITGATKTLMSSLMISNTMTVVMTLLLIWLRKVMTKPVRRYCASYNATRGMKNVNVLPIY